MKNWKLSVELVYCTENNHLITYLQSAGFNILVHNMITNKNTALESLPEKYSRNLTVCCFKETEYPDVNFMEVVNNDNFRVLEVRISANANL